MKFFWIVGMPLRFTIIIPLITFIGVVFGIIALFSPEKGWGILREKIPAYFRWAYDPKLEPELFENDGYCGDM